MRRSLDLAGLTLALGLAGGCGGCASSRASSSASVGSAAAPGWPLVAAPDLTSAACLAAFECSDPSRWRWREVLGRPALELLGDSGYQPPVRSPTSIALLRGVEVADFDLDVDVLQTGRDYGHRDLCLFFGFAGPTRFYYVHLAKTPDANAHNIFCVDDAPRRHLAPIAARGIEWGQDVWHHVHVERRVATGSIAVYWDGGTQPILQATNQDFAWGRVGFGSFDDSGCLAALQLRAPAVRASHDDVWSPVR